MSTRRRASRHAAESALIVLEKIRTPSPIGPACSGALDDLVTKHRNAL